MNESAFAHIGHSIDASQARKKQQAMAPPMLKLTLYEANENEDWTPNVGRALNKNGWSVQRTGERRLQAWGRNDLEAVCPSLYFVDGVEIGTVWLAHGKVGVRIAPKRLYFAKSELNAPLEEREFVILGNRKRPGTAGNALLSRVLKVGEALVGVGALKPVELNRGTVDMHGLESCCAVGGSANTFQLSWDLWRGLRDAKPFRIPDEFKIIVVHDMSQRADVVVAYLDAMSREWLPALGVGNAAERIVKVSLKKALMQMKEVEKGGRTASLVGSVFLIPISGKPGDPLPKDQREFLELLDRLQVEYRVFSYENTEPKWSARAQISSIIQGAGGIPYRLMLPLPEEIDDCLFFGVDIGHDHRDKRVSRVVVSVSDKYGVHLLSVWSRQKLNEAAANDVLIKMIATARRLAFGELGRKIGSSIVLRDGRIPNARSGTGAECLSTYLQALGSDTTVVECRKGGNPMMYLEGSGQSTPAPAGCGCQPQDSPVKFVCTHDSPQGLASILKVHIPKDGDGLGIGVDGMSRILIGLSYSPSLGLRPHLPGPIYWADGIGATGENRYQFAGQPAHEFIP